MTTDAIRSIQVKNEQKQRTIDHRNSPLGPLSTREELRRAAQTAGISEDLKNSCAKTHFLFVHDTDLSACLMKKQGDAYPVPPLPMQPSSVKGRVAVDTTTPRLEDKGSGRQNHMPCTRQVTTSDKAAL
ncbi:hypothetical protein E2C01_063406 [Portunus trituberculatus]|uniref:Uncharacterized protein n=1 Tax=Portunus trituberculatus TaxID=210409 RepID=A0A5B7H924_PORTR|nr:hypothetical protein [Portunus trituberculatus]